MQIGLNQSQEISCVHATSLQSYQTLCDPRDCSPPGSSVHGTLPGKNTGAGVCVTCSLMSDSLQRQGLQPTRLLCPWDAPDKNSGVGCPALLQGIFPIQRLNLCFLGVLHWQAVSLPLEPAGEFSVVLCLIQNSRLMGYVANRPDLICYMLTTI